MATDSLVAALLRQKGRRNAEINGIFLASLPSSLVKNLAGSEAPVAIEEESSLSVAPEDELGSRIFRLRFPKRSATAALDKWVTEVREATAPELRQIARDPQRSQRYKHMHLRSDRKMGIYLSTPKTEKFSEDGENARLRFGLSSMQGWRTAMEDAHAALPDLDKCTSFFGVYDGHGGKVVAKFCAKYLHTQMLKNEEHFSGDLGASVQKAFFRMDEMMLGQRGWRELAGLGDKINKFTGMIEGLIWSPRGGDSAQQDNWGFEEGPHSDFSGPTSGCTACVAVIRNNQLIVANAGDSRCVISRKGQAYNLSRDHKPELESEKERILKAGGFIHAGRVNGSLNLSRAIGDMEFKQNKFLPADKQIITANPDINIVNLCDDDDFIVLACDGVWDCMSSQQLVDFIHENINTENLLSAVCEKVLDRCLAPSTIGGEGCDNMTMILLQFKKPVNSSADSTGQSTQTSPEVNTE